MKNRPTPLPIPKQGILCDWPCRAKEYMKAIARLAVAAVFLAGCGGNGSSSSSAPVTPQPTFSDGSVAGEYNLSAMFSSGVPGNDFNAVGTGTIVADGRGNFASGALTLTGGGQSCSGGVFGTYNVAQNGIGTAHLEFTSFDAGNNGCLSVGNDFTITVSNGGKKVAFVSPGFDMTALLP